MTNRLNRGWRIRGNTAYEFAPGKGRTRGDRPPPPVSRNRGRWVAPHSRGMNRVPPGAKWGEARSPCGLG